VSQVAILASRTSDVRMLAVLRPTPATYPEPLTVYMNHKQRIPICGVGLVKYQVLLQVIITGYSEHINP